MRVAVLLLVLFLGGRAPLAGQTTGTGRASPSLDAWRASLAAASDTMALLRLEQEKITAAKAQRDSALVHLELGFLSLRLAELGGRNHYEDAAGEFEWVIELEPTWAFPWFGLALAEQGLGDSRLSAVAGVQALLRRDKLSRSAAALLQALDVEPGFAPALIELARVALTQRFNACGFEQERRPPVAAGPAGPRAQPIRAGRRRRCPRDGYAPIHDRADHHRIDRYDRLGGRARAGAANLACASRPRARGADATRPRGTLDRSGWAATGIARSAGGIVAAGSARLGGRHATRDAL